MSVHNVFRMTGKQECALWTNGYIIDFHCSLQVDAFKEVSKAPEIAKF